MENRRLSVVKTLTYSDIFDHPLLFDEIYYFLATDTTLSLSELKKTVDTLSHGKKRSLVKKNGYYTFLDRQDTITRREASGLVVKSKIILARKIASILIHIPSILFIGISGAVAGGNPTEEDDIDLFIITSKGTLYTTRFLLLGVLELIGKRRRRDQADVKDKLCLNMLIDETALAFADSRRDLYTAREIAQVIPLFDRKGTYKSFLKANDWTLAILAHARGRQGCISYKERTLLVRVLTGLESMLRIIQTIFIKRHSTKEEASSTLLAFHPRDVRKGVLLEYEKRLRHYIKCYNI